MHYEQANLKVQEIITLENIYIKTKRATNLVLQNPREGKKVGFLMIPTIQKLFNMHIFPTESADKRNCTNQGKSS